MCWMRERSWVLILTSIFSCASFACLCVAVVTDHWLYASERLNNTDLFRNTTAGLWRKCINDVSFAPPDWCERIDYFKHIERDGLAPTESILLSLRKFALFPLLSLLILLVGECCCVVSQCNPQKNTLTLVSGIMFVIGGLFVLIGMVIFIGAVTEEASNSKSKSSADDNMRPFYYRYGPSFILTIFSFISSEGTGVLSVYLYISLYQSAYRKDRDHLEIPVDVNSEALSPTVPEQSQERQCLSNRFNRSRSDILMESTLLPDDDDASNICTSPLVDSIGSDAALLSGLLKSPAEYQGRNNSGALSTLFSPVSIQKNRILQNQHQTRSRKDSLALSVFQKKAQSRQGPSTLSSGQGKPLLMDNVYCYDHAGHRNVSTTVATAASTVILNPSVVAQTCDHHISTFQQQKVPSQQQAYRFFKQSQQLLEQVQQFPLQQTQQFLKQSKPLKPVQQLQNPAQQELAQKQQSQQTGMSKRSLDKHRQDSLYQKQSKQPAEQPQNLQKKSQHRQSQNRHDWLTNSPSPTALYKDSATQYSPLLAQSTAPVSFKTFDALQQQEHPRGAASSPKSRKNGSRPSRDFAVARDLNSRSSNKRDFNENRIHPHRIVNRTFHASERQNQQRQHICLQRQCSSSFRHLDHIRPVDDIIALDESPLTGSSCMARSAYYLPVCGGDVKNTDDWNSYESPFDRAKSMHELRYFSYCNPQHLKSLVQPLLDDDSSFFFGRTTPV